MTVPTLNSVAEFVTNGVTTNFPFFFKFLANEDLVVTYVDPLGVSSVLTLGTQYTVNGAGDEDGGSVVTVSALAGPGQLVVSREMDAYQQTSLRNQGKFLAETHEDVFDKLTMLIQQGFAVNQRALTRPFGKNYYDAKNRNISNVADPLLPQDAATKNWSLTAIAAAISSTIGPINNSANVYMTGPDGLPYVVQDVASITDASKGSSLIGFKRKALTKKITTVSESLSGAPVNIWEYADQCIGYVAGGSPSTWDWKPAIQAAVNAWSDVCFPPMSVAYRVNGEITLNSNNCITMSGGVKIQQIAVNMTTFKAIQKDNVWLHCNGAMILGEGSWSNAWTGMGGHEDRAIQLWGCTNSGVTLARIRNCASAGIAIFGGSNILLMQPKIEGTHLYGHPIPALGNFQVGIYIRDETTYGVCDNLIILAPDISGVAQGILSELYAAASIISRAHQIIGAVIHDIPGQHAFYIQGGVLAISNPVLTNINLAGVKIQSADSNAAIRSFSATGVTADGIGSNLFEMNCTGTGSVNGVILSGTVNGCAVGLACNGQIRDLQCDLIVTNATSNAVLIQGNGAKDIDVRVIGQGIGDDGILITATNATGIRISPKIREPNQNSNVTGSGLLLQSASAEVFLNDAVFTDVSSKMTYGIFHSTAGSTLKVRGSLAITGALDVAVRATGKITEFPSDANLQGNNGQYIGIGNITSTTSLKSSVLTGSAANVVLWQENMPASSLVFYKVKLASKLVTSAEYKVVEFTVAAFRTGAGVATLMAAPAVTVNITTAGHAGVFTFASNGADAVVLSVNSGGAQTYSWTAEVTRLERL
ncbi:hypothetical protein HA62_29830 [Pseudomonas putida]|nr:hypothetical protein HA62_29830 [Pseudomonas putida]